MHIDADQGTLLGVTAGAVLATLGGLLSGQVENRLKRREREQSAALLFGEILAALRLTFRLADEARGRGEPYGPVTLQILRAAQRETQIYDRNREILFDIGNPTLRADTHLVVLQIGLTLDAFLETATARRATAAVAGPKTKTDNSDLDGSFGFLMELKAEIPSLIAAFEKIALQTFDAHDLAIQRITGPRRPPADATAPGAPGPV